MLLKGVIQRKCGLAREDDCATFSRESVSLSAPASGTFPGESGERGRRQNRGDEEAGSTGAAYTGIMSW